MYRLRDFSEVDAQTLTEICNESRAPVQVHLVEIKKSLKELGLGKKLMKFVIQCARDCGKGMLRLYTRPWNTAITKACTDTGFILEAYLRKEYL